MAQGSGRSEEQVSELVAMFASMRAQVRAAGCRDGIGLTGTCLAGSERPSMGAECSGALLACGVGDAWAVLRCAFRTHSAKQPVRQPTPRVKSTLLRFAVRSESAVQDSLCANPPHE